MKKLMMIVALLIVPLIGEAREPVSHTGSYRDCVRWTTYNGMETSKQFELELREDDSISLVISFYRGTAECAGDNKEILVEYRNFEILDDLGRDYPARIMTIHEVEKGIYFKLLLTGDSVSVHSSDSLPVKYDYMRAAYLKKVN